MVQLLIGSLSLTGDDPTEGPNDLSIIPKGLQQVTEAIGAAGINIQDRGNYSHTITFSVQRQHLTAGVADPELAAYFLDTHILAVEQVGRAVFTKKTRAGTTYYTPALAIVTQSSVQGCRTFHSYKILAGIITTSAPPGASGGTLDAGNPTFGGGYTIG